MATIALPPQLVKGRDTPVVAYKLVDERRPERGMAHERKDLTWTPWSYDKVRKTFEAENAPVRALRGVDLIVPSGDFVALMGPSGCGKSTLLNLVAGLDVADEGTITVAGEQVTGRTEDELSQLRRKHIGIVFQFFNLLEGMTVLENVALPAVIAGRKRRMAETRARDLLDLLGIGDKATTVPGHALGWPAPAPRHRPGAGQRADAPAGGRADRRARLRGRPGGHRAAEPAARRWADHRPRDARPGASPRRSERVVRMRDGRITADEDSDLPVAVPS